APPSPTGAIPCRTPPSPRLVLALARASTQPSPSPSATLALPAPRPSSGREVKTPQLTRPRSPDITHPQFPRSRRSVSSPLFSSALVAAAFPRCSQFSYSQASASDFPDAVARQPPVAAVAAEAAVAAVVAVPPRPTTPSPSS